jgi:hypothetical protein
MTTAQCSFDELIAKSLSALDRANNDGESTIQFNQTTVGFDPASSVGSIPNSIDTFLADYRHELSSIRDFIFHADDLSETQPSHLFENRCFAETTPCSSNIVVPNIPCDSKSSAAWVSSVEKTNKHCSKSADQPPRADGVRDVAEASSPISKRRVRIKLSAEKKEERRRDQNREYQRRYREKRMRLEMQRLYSSFQD